MTLKRQFLRPPATTTASRTRTAAATGCSAKASIRRASTGSLPGSCTGSLDDNFLVIPTQVGIQSSALAGMRRVIVMTRYAELEVTTNFSFLNGGSHPEE